MIKAQLKNIVADTSGATAVEYGLILSLVVLAVMASLQGVAGTAIAMWNSVDSKIVEATNK
jgi:pilus assembly protein Flp/PilA